MQILSSEQIRAWDNYTIQREPIASIDLMERAAATCVQWILQHYEAKSFSIFCAKGNNGGDGLAIARMLSANHSVTVYILEFGHLGTDDFQANLARLHQTQVIIKFISTEDNIPEIPHHDIIIDALLGSGLNRPVEGLTASLVSTINNSGNEVVAIDIPSGLSADNSSKGNVAVKASHTLSFQVYKPAFLFAENESNIGRLHILDIGLHGEFLEDLGPENTLIDKHLVRSIIRPRSVFSHKGTFGHALLVCGSYGKIGAATLAGKACLRSGTGLLTIHAPECATNILQTSVPEAMLDPDVNERINTTITSQLNKYHAIGIGPGIGTDYATAGLLPNIFSSYNNPIVLDADALNILGTHPDWLQQIPPHSILTPHPREFERLFGVTGNDFEKIQLAKKKAKEYKVVIVLKGHHTFIATPDGESFFNSSGNPGMATGGSGDVLTGMITAFVAQRYSPVHAAIAAVYLHGVAGDIAANQVSEHALIATDIIENIGHAFKAITPVETS